MPISSKHLLSLMCRHLLALSFLTTRHNGTPSFYDKNFAYYVDFMILRQVSQQENPKFFAKLLPAQILPKSADKKMHLECFS